jgi:ankyrin repeat protein
LILKKKKKQTITMKRTTLSDLSPNRTGPNKRHKPEQEKTQQELNDQLLSHAQQNDVEAVKSDIEQGADLTYVNHNSQSIAYIAAAVSSLDILRLLSKHTHLQSIAGPLGAFPQHIAADNGHLDALRILVQSEGAPQNQQTNGGRTPLYMSAQSNQANCVHFLLTDPSSKADVLQHDINQVTPLAIACQLGCYDAVKLLVNHVKPDLLEKMLRVSDCAGYTPLHTAAWAGNRDIVQLLMEKGGDPTARNYNDQSPMDICEDMTARHILGGRVYLNVDQFLQ